MSASAFVVEGVVKPDGTLEIAEKVCLPAGRVQVTVQPVAEPVRQTRFEQMLASIWSHLQASQRTPRGRGEIDAEVSALREEAEQEMQAVEKLEEASRNAQTGPGEGKEPGP